MQMQRLQALRSHLLPPTHSAAQDLLSGQFNVTLGDKLSEHLKKWIDVSNVLQTPQPVRRPLTCIPAVGIYSYHHCASAASCACAPASQWATVHTSSSMLHKLLPLPWTAGFLGAGHRMGGGCRHARHFPQAAVSS